VVGYQNALMETRATASVTASLKLNRQLCRPGRYSTQRRRGAEGEGGFGGPRSPRAIPRRGEI
jgi:hypothetical protein